MKKRHRARYVGRGLELPCFLWLCYFSSTSMFHQLKSSLKPSPFDFLWKLDFLVKWLIRSLVIDKWFASQPLCPPQRWWWWGAEVSILQSRGWGPLSFSLPSLPPPPGGGGNQIPPFGGPQRHIITTTKDTLKALLSGNSRGFRSSMPEAALKTKDLFLIINHNIMDGK